MQRKLQTFTSLFSLAACAVLALGTLGQVQAADKADPNGTWTWTTPGRNGGPDRKITLKLKADGDKLTGKVSSPGRDGQSTDTDISDGKIKGEEISFSVTREFNGNSFTMKYNGKISGDTIKGKSERPGRDGGDPTVRDWEAKREK